MQSSTDIKAGSAGSGESTQADAPRILIVEDDPAQRDTLRRFLEQVGYRVASAADFDAALGAAKQHAPDVAICDWMIEGRRTGVDVARALHDRYRMAIIFVTGASLAELQRESADIPVAHYFRKPVPPDTLARAVERLR